MEFFATYHSPFEERYKSPEMSSLFSSHFRALCYRKLWLALASIEQKLGVAIEDEQIREMEKNLEPIDFKKIQQYEKALRHDVMAHILAFGDRCPKARKIIHLGATSCFVTDNTDLIQMREGLKILFAKLCSLIQLLRKLADGEKESVCLAYTHFQPALPTTIGKRICLWLQDFLFDAQEIQRLIETLPFLGAKGATGTAASFLQLFDSDEKKVEKLEEKLRERFGFSHTLRISGQTYTRKIDIGITQALASFSASAHKVATDIRLLSHEKQILEPFSETQVGSSAMPFKKNPIYSERICGIARFALSLAQNAPYTLSTQWLERSLDDSANRRLYLPQIFFSADAQLQLLLHLFHHIEIDREKAQTLAEDFSPYFSMEKTLMEEVMKGKDRQDVHEALKRSQPEGKKIRGAELLRFTGRAKTQVEEFLKKEVDPFLKTLGEIKPFSSHLEV